MRLKARHYIYRYARGRGFEKKVLKELGLAKNTKKVMGRIPDSLSKGELQKLKMSERYHIPSSLNNMRSQVSGLI